MILNEEDKKALKLQGEDCFIAAECFFERAFKRPTYLFKQRGKAAATAHLQRNLININPILFFQNKEDFFEQVMAHEVAHLITYQLYGKTRPHGKEWQQIMQSVFKLPAQTTHSLNIDDVIGQQFPYFCLCREHKLTIRRHNKILKGYQYRCKNCQGQLSQTQKVI